MNSNVGFNKLLKRLSLAGAMLTVITLMSCGGGATGDLPAANSTQPPFLALLPALPSPADAGRAASAQQNDVILGKDYYSPSGSATVEGNSVRLPSAAGGIQWAIYRYTAGANTLVSMTVNHTEHSGTSTWVGLANFTLHAWQFFGTYPAGSPVISLSNTDNKSGGGDLFFVVITYDGTDTSVDSIDITVDTPTTTWSILGTVLQDGTTPLLNAQITLNPGGVHTLTNASGSYSFSGLSAGTYTVTPALTGFDFTPLNRTVVITNANQAGIDFTATAQTSVTYTADIQPLLALKCTSCHNAGSASGGIKLDTYADASANASLSNSDIQSGNMPPFGGPLTTEQKALFQAWIDAGKPL